MFDRIIKGGTVVDGTGAPQRTADIAIADGRIAEIGRVSAAAHEVIDADGLLVTPGWVDLHTHYDGQVTWDPLLTPSFWHGDTTLLMGNCGVGFAPCRPEKREWLIGLMEGVEDIPGAALSEGIRWDWETFPEYLDAVAALPHAIDVGTQLAHGALRAYVMGERGARNEAASPDDLAAMSRLAREAMDAGAFGISTSRTVLHRAIDGEPVPGTFAAEEELRALAGAIAASGHGLMEVAPAGILGEDIIAPDKEIAWMARVSAETGCPITFLLGQTMAQPTYWRDAMAKTRRAAATGARVTPQVFVRAVGLLMGLESRFGPFMTAPTLLALAHLPTDVRIRRLREDEGLRRRIASEGFGGPQPVEGVDPMLQAMFSNDPWATIYRMGNPGNYEPAPEDSVKAIAGRNGQDPREAALDIMLEDDGRGFLYRPVQGYADGDLEAIREMMVDPMTVLGGSDGGAHCGAIVDASAPSFLLTHWVRDRQRGARIPLEFAVRKHTADAARLYGLDDRGMLKPGLRADINLIDFGALGLSAPAMHYDLPSGAARLMQTARGYKATLVAGEIVQRDGVETGARPGRLVRSSAAA